MWSSNIPTNPGPYWFYGDPFSTHSQMTRLYFVWVRKVSNGNMYVAEGNFMENYKGLWQEIVLPEPPEKV
jgi:hypothetical protein